MIKIYQDEWFCSVQDLTGHSCMEHDGVLLKKEIFERYAFLE